MRRGAAARNKIFFRAHAIKGSSRYRCTARKAEAGRSAGKQNHGAAPNEFRPAPVLVFGINRQPVRSSSGGGDLKKLANCRLKQDGVVRAPGTAKPRDADRLRLQMVRAAPPATATFFSLPSEAKKAIQCPSGEKKGEAAPSVPAIGSAFSASRGRRKQLRRSLPASGNINEVGAIRRDRDHGSIEIREDVRREPERSLCATPAGPAPVSASSLRPRQCQRQQRPQANSRRLRGAGFSLRG